MSARRRPSPPIALPNRRSEKRLPRLERCPGDGAGRGASPEPAPSATSDGAGRRSADIALAHSCRLFVSALAGLNDETAMAFEAHSGFSSSVWCLRAGNRHGARALTRRRTHAVELGSLPHLALPPPMQRAVPASRPCAPCWPAGTPAASPMSRAAPGHILTRALAPQGFLLDLSAPDRFNARQTCPFPTD